jgi:hypothetical protein
MDPLLADALKQIAAHDTDYATRYGLVLQAMNLANIIGLPTGIRIDPAEPEWPVVYIELPTGQVSWHMPQHPHEFDGHTTEEKYRRIADYAGGTESPRFRAGLAKLRTLGAGGVEIGCEPGWWLACQRGEETVHSGHHASPADAVEALVRAVETG